MFLDAVVLMMVAYFVYGIEYSKQLKNSLIFIENCILNIEESKLTTTVLRTNLISWITQMLDQ